MKYTESTSKIGKWDRFRDERGQVIESYCMLRKRSSALNHFVILYNTLKFIKKIRAKYQNAWDKHEREIKTMFVCIIIKHQWRRKMKARGKDFLDIQKKKFRYCYTLLGIVKEGAIKKAMKQVSTITRKVLQVEVLIETQRRWRKSFCLI